MISIMKKTVLFLMFLVLINSAFCADKHFISVIKDWKIVPTSLVRQGNTALQRIEMSIISTSDIKSSILTVWEGTRLLYKTELNPIKAGTNHIVVEFPEPKAVMQSRWVLSSISKVLSEREFKWEPPRHWTLYVIKSSHVDIGLHDSQYKQRHYTVNYIDKAVALIDSTKLWPEPSRFRYIVEGEWWWLNYPNDRSEEMANEVIKKYGTTGLLGIGASHSGNHTQVFGTEELCRSTYYTQELRNRWALDENAMLMVDNNGITWPLVSAYANAGIKYLGFFPNTWNPKTVGGAKIDVAFESKIPNLFYWQGPDNKSKILVWSNPHYIHTAQEFGFQTCKDRNPFITNIDSIAPKMADQLLMLESKYPYNIWLIPNYDDNESPNLILSEMIKNWNGRWRWPALRTVGDLSQPFRELEERFGDKIPTLSGMITGGWAQHPVSTPTLLAAKLESERLLPTSEKLATLAFLIDSTYIYPRLNFEQAWNALICNDEHGYGTSNYKGRPVYDTWMQKMDWIEQAGTIAKEECDNAVNALISQINVNEPSVVVFNPMLQSRIETVEVELPEKLSQTQQVECEDRRIATAVVYGDKLRFRTNEVPPLGYKVFKLKNGKAGKTISKPEQNPPSMENDYYHIRFSANGSISGIYDKELGKELIDSSAEYQANQFVYTRDAHQTFSSPQNARFTLASNSLEQVVTVQTKDSVSGAFIEQKVSLPNFEKRIDIDNKLDHVSDLASGDRWSRFGYYAFPFKVPEGKFRVGLNGCDADAYKDQTGHGTNTYHVARDWAYVGNDQYGIALIQQDNYLIEFGKIHKNKTIIEERPSSTYFFPYIFNDWLYAHAYVTGPSYINLRYRFTIYSHKGKFEEGEIHQLAERKVSPLIAKAIEESAQGKFTDLSKSFLSVNSPDISLLTLKLSDIPGKGIIARFHETAGKEKNNVTVNVEWDGSQKLTECNLTEQDGKTVINNSIDFSPFGYSTLRIESGKKALSSPNVVISKSTDKSITLNWPPVEGAKGYNVFRGEYFGFIPDQYHLIGQITDSTFTDDWLDTGETNYYVVSAYGEYNQSGLISSQLTAHTDSKRYSPPVKVGMFDTGLISTPKAWRGDEDTILYLQWGQNKEKDIVYYELFRSEKDNFDLNNKTFVSKVAPGLYVTVPFEDTGLKPHTTYYYRVRAVDRNGRHGESSELFQGTTREIEY